MKAVLVIDMPDNLKKAIEEIRVDIKANLYGNEILDWRNQTIKPMPKKKGISLKEAIGEKCSCYSDGWNDCIDEILGEAE